MYYFAPGQLAPAAGEYVIVETARGEECGEVVKPVHEVPDSKISKPLRPALRMADAIDLRRMEKNRADEKRAFEVCAERIEKHKLEMKLVDVEYTLDRSKILFYFTADGRVDFRDLVKDLAGVFHTRIELRQIGVRDESKMLGGIGICGQPFCCSRFLKDFQPVSIKMAKAQGLSLNPAKISGSCGRLMCCLAYEQPAYEYLNSITPGVGSIVNTPDGTGVVMSSPVCCGCGLTHPARLCAAMPRKCANISAAASVCPKNRSQSPRHSRSCRSRNNSCKIFTLCYNKKTKRQKAGPICGQAAGLFAEDRPCAFGPRFPGRKGRKSLFTARRRKVCSMAYKISDDCIACGTCAGVCPVGAISEGDGKYVIDADACLDCGTCAGECPVSAISEG